MLSIEEKKEILRSVFGEGHHSAGNNFPAFSEFMDRLSSFNDTATIIELLPHLDKLLGSRFVAPILSTASFVGVLLFPVQQLITVANAYQVGLKMYSFRSIAYTITSWAFDRPIPTQSGNIISNIQSGLVKARDGYSVAEYNKVWNETSSNVMRTIRETASRENIPVDSLKAVFRGLGYNRPDKLCSSILQAFEEKLDPIPKITWKSNYKIAFPN